MAQRLITAVRKADLILKSALFDGNYKIFQQVQPNLVQLVNAGTSTDPQIQYDALNSVRKLLTSSGHNPPIDVLTTSCNILPSLVDCLSSPNPALQFDAFAQAGAVPHFRGLLTSEHQNVREKALFALGSIILKGPQLRDCVINLGVVAPLLNCIQPDTPITFLRAVASVICILCLHWGKPLTPETVREILPTLNVLVHHNDPVVLFVSVWTLKLLTDGGKEQIQMVIDSGVLPKLVQLRNHGKKEVQEVAVRAVCNIVNGADGQMQSVLNCDTLSDSDGLLLGRCGGERLSDAQRR